MSIRLILSSVNWERNILHRNPNNQVDFLTNYIENAFLIFAIHKIVRCRHHNSPWMSSAKKQKLKEN